MVEISIAKTPIEIVDIENEHIEQVVDVHLQAFREYLNSRLGQGYVKRFIRWFASSDQAIAVCAVNAKTNIVQGYLVGAPLGYTRNLTRHIFWSAFWGVITHIGVFFEPKYFRILMARLGLLRSPVDQAPKLPIPTISLVAIGVHPSAQGKNIGKSLVQSFEECAAQQKMKSLRLSVYPDNITARNLYESMGWQPYLEKETPSGAMYYYKVIS